MPRQHQPTTTEHRCPWRALHRSMPWICPTGTARSVDLRKAAWPTTDISPTSGAAGWKATCWTRAKQTLRKPLSCSSAGAAGSLRPPTCIHCRYRLRAAQLRAAGHRRWIRRGAITMLRPIGSWRAWPSMPRWRGIFDSCLGAWPASAPCRPGCATTKTDSMPRGRSLMPGRLCVAWAEQFPPPGCRLLVPFPKRIAGRAAGRCGFTRQPCRIWRDAADFTRPVSGQDRGDETVAAPLSRRGVQRIPTAGGGRHRVRGAIRVGTGLGLALQAVCFDSGRYQRLAVARPQRHGIEVG